MQTISIAPSIATTTPSPASAPVLGPAAPAAPAPAPQRPQIPVAYFDALRTARSAAADAIAGVRALDRTAPLTDTPAVTHVIETTKSVLGALRAAAAIEGINPKLQSAATNPIDALTAASLLLTGTVKIGGPARTDLVLDQLDTQLSNAWMTASRLLTKLGQPVE